MGRKSKGHQPPTLIRQVVADNLVGLRDKRLAALPNETQRNKVIAKALGTTLSQIQRIINRDLGTSIDQIEGLAKALDCRPQDLLTPYFSNTAGEERDPPGDSFPKQSRG